MENINDNYNRSFENKTAQMLQDQAEKLKTPGEKYNEFKEEIKVEPTDNSEKMNFNRYNDPIPKEDVEKKKKKNFLFTFLDNVAG